MKSAKVNKETGKKLSFKEAIKLALRTPKLTRKQIDKLVKRKDLKK